MPLTEVDELKTLSSCDWCNINCELWGNDTRIPSACWTVVWGYKLLGLMLTPVWLVAPLPRAAARVRWSMLYIYCGHNVEK